MVSCHYKHLVNNEMNYIEFLRNIKFDVGNTFHNRKLSYVEASELCLEVIDNVYSLFDDARILKENNKIARASSIAALCIEEIGKLEIIREIFKTSNNDIARKEFWKDFRNHKSKNIFWTLPHLHDNEITINDFEEIFNKKGNPAKFLDSIKMAGFYVDLNEEGKIISPQKINNQVYEDTYNTAGRVLFNVSLDLYSFGYFKSLNRMLFIDKKVYSNEIYTYLLEDNVINEEQFNKIISNMFKIKNIPNT